MTDAPTTGPARYARPSGTRRAARLARRNCAGVSGQPVTCAADGLQALPSERGVDLAAEIADVHLNNIGVAIVVGVPYVVQDVGLTHRVTGSAHQELEQ